MNPRTIIPATILLVVCPLQAPRAQVTLNCSGPKCAITTPGACTPSSNSYTASAEDTCASATSGSATCSGASCYAMATTYCSGSTSKTTENFATFPDGCTPASLELSAGGGSVTTQQCQGGWIGPYQEWQCWPYFALPIASDGYYEVDAWDNPVTTSVLFCGFASVSYTAGAVCTNYKAGTPHLKYAQYVCCSGCSSTTARGSERRGVVMRPTSGRAPSGGNLSRQPLAVPR
jgi:hypothetical protein